MVKSKIEWTDYSWNPIKGYCPNTCNFCYAHRMYNRFRWDKRIRFDKEEIKKICKVKKPSKIFVGSMIDMYHPAIPAIDVNKIIDMASYSPQHTYITLTKNPQNLRYHYFHKWWWVGVTIDKNIARHYHLLDSPYAGFIEGKRFISFEPLLEPMYDIDFHGMDWLIIGGLTPKNVHKTEWIDDIVNRADKLNIPVYIKENANYKERRKFFPNFKV